MQQSQQREVAKALETQKRGRKKWACVMVESSPGAPSFPNANVIKYLIGFIKIFVWFHRLCFTSHKSHYREKSFPFLSACTAHTHRHEPLGLLLCGHVRLSVYMMLYYIWLCLGVCVWELFFGPFVRSSTNYYSSPKRAEEPLGKPCSLEITNEYITQQQQRRQTLA